MNGLGHHARIAKRYADYCYLEHRLRAGMSSLTTGLIDTMEKINGDDMERTTKYKCNECGQEWYHIWDDEDMNDDYTQCPNECEEFDFDEIE